MVIVEALCNLFSSRVKNCNYYWLLCVLLLARSARNVPPKKFSLRSCFTLSNLTNCDSAAVESVTIHNSAASPSLMIHNLAAFYESCQSCEKLSYFIQLQVVRWLLNYESSYFIIRLPNCIFVRVLKVKHERKLRLFIITKQ